MSTRRLQKLRLVMADRQGWLCYWCKLPMLPVDHPDSRLRCTADHVQPRSEGGQTTAANVVAAHRLCNAGRHHPSLKEKIMVRLKLCIDCRHLIVPDMVINIPGYFRAAAECGHPSAVWEHIDLVDGERSSGIHFCKRARSSHEPALCGPEGRFWKSKGFAE
jgi:HNH endonuclease